MYSQKILFLNYGMSQIMMLHQYEKDLFAVPLINIIKNSEESQEESDLLKADLYFSVQPHKPHKSDIFTTFKKIHRSFINKLKSEESKSHLKVFLFISPIHIYTSTDLQNCQFKLIFRTKILEREGSISLSSFYRQLPKN